MREMPDHAPSPDVPSLSVRWEGLSIVVDATTLNAVLRHATRRFPEIKDRKRRIFAAMRWKAENLSLVVTPSPAPAART